MFFRSNKKRNENGRVQFGLSRPFGRARQSELHTKQDARFQGILPELFTSES
jgi:hypothetical protein